MHAARHSDLPTHLLVVGGSFFYPRELTASGLTLPREALATEPLCALRPGDLLAATLRLEGPHGAVEGRVIARLVGQEDEVAEFAFLMLPVRLRRLLDRAAPLVAGPAAQPTPRLPDTFALAFAKLDEPLGPERRLALPESAPVYALSRARRYGVFTPPTPALHAASAPPPPAGQRPSLATPLFLLFLLLATVGMVAGSVLLR